MPGKNLLAVLTGVATHRYYFFNIIPASRFKFSLLFYLLFFYTLIVISFIDIPHQVIPNKILLLLIISGILLNFAFKIIPWPQAKTVALLAGVIICLIRILGQLVFKKESMGIGLEYSVNENNSPAIILIIDFFYT